ncbi:hypothetical protein FDECE_14411 [Fusarium decemcellulare]|nr:hypothetical protein FDECE_14411 [Fusarium decemcellulare]
MHQFQQFNKEEFAWDRGLFRFGRVGTYRVVLISPLEKGHEAAAKTATFLRSTFQNLNLLMVVGICGGIPGAVKGQELLLGDIIVYIPRIEAEQGVQERMASMREELDTEDSQQSILDRTMYFLKELQRAAPTKYEYPGVKNDRFYPDHYRHRCSKCRLLSDSTSCECKRMPCDMVECGDDQLVPRIRIDFKRKLEQDGRIDEAQAPHIIVGSFKSSEEVVRTPDERRRIEAGGAIAVEMEADALREQFPFVVVIRGVSDYADSHKNDLYQKPAAANAASAEMAFLERLGS